MREPLLFERVLLRQRGHLFGWVPVCIAVGVAFYFGLRMEPTWIWYAAAIGAAVVFVLLGRMLPEAIGPLPFAAALMLTGFVIAGARAHHVAAPVLTWRYYGPVEGRIIAIDRSSSDALRITLDRVVLERTAPMRTPHKIRISLHDKDGLGVLPTPGLRVMTTAHLSPPNGPVEPSAFDFRRHAWFGGLGGVGYSRVPLVALELPPPRQLDLIVFKIRMSASAQIQEVLAGDVGGFGAAITTGDRSAISQQALGQLRASNLAHLLAISGLHMGLLCGFVFALLRIVIALFPPLALRIPGRSYAALGALIAGAGYLALSGGNVATVRAFMMAATALVAVMLGRRAISLRAVAIAAVLLLCLQPEALLGPGFQMSFAATTALVAVFGWIRDHSIKIGPNWAKPVVAVIMSSGIAGFATAPIGAAHFNTLSSYGLIANLLSVPLMGALVIPAAVVALLLAPFGAQWIGLWVMGLGLRWILGVAEFVTSLGGSQRYVVGPDTAVLPLLCLGFLFIVLWQGRARLLGVGAMGLAMMMWFGTERPLGLIAQNGGLVGVMTDEGRALSKKRGAGFAARNWLENDGDPSEQSTAALLWPPDGMPLGAERRLIMHLPGKRAQQSFGRCVPGQILVLSLPAAREFAGCDVYDPSRLKHTGSLAIIDFNGSIMVQSAREITGDRLWTNWPSR